MTQLQDREVAAYHHPYLTTFVRYWPILLVAAVLGGLAGWGASRVATPVYQSRSSLYFSLSSGASGNDLNQGSEYTQGQMLSFAALAKSSAVLAPVVDELHLDSTPVELARAIDVTAAENTVVLQITASDVSARQATRIANAVGDSLSNEVANLAPKTAKNAISVTVRTIQPATIPTSPSSPNTAVNTAAGFLIGLLLAALVLALIRLFDSTVRSESDIDRTTRLPVLGELAREPAGAVGLTLGRDPLSTEAERYRSLRIALADKAAKKPVIVVTSSLEGEGKSTVACNLALAIGETGRRAVVVEADLRHPRLADVFGLAPSTGLTGILAGTSEITDAVRPSSFQNVDVLTAGEASDNPSTALTSPRMTTVISQLKRSYDAVIIDAPSLDTGIDAAIVGGLADGAVVVAGRGSVRMPQLLRTLAALERSGVTILGIALNRMPLPRRQRSRRGARLGAFTLNAEPVTALGESVQN
ncbi:polysaccharide biosynthesis tyrosine autokinase [Parafrigoribacterium soli]|uniref:polysaccharide biosynthesis tyrosine autokinase n=1 Tax=Parafrigoribacterium soli TaxID=3144663 RepID=UPI0032ED8C36